MTVKHRKVRKTFTLTSDALSILNGVNIEERSQFVSDALQYFSDHHSGPIVRDDSVSDYSSDPVGFELFRLKSVLAKLDSLDFSSYSPWVAFFNDPEVKIYPFIEHSFAEFVHHSDSRSGLSTAFIKSYPVNFPLRSFILVEVSKRVSGLVDSGIDLKDFLSRVIREGVISRILDLHCFQEFGMNCTDYEFNFPKYDSLS